LLTETAFSNLSASLTVAIGKSASEPHKQRAVACVADQKADTAQLSLFDVPHERSKGTEGLFSKARFKDEGDEDEERL
jgi:hypothetical protein